MSSKEIVDVVCPKCGNKDKMEVWSSINIWQNPELKSALLEGKINLFHCENCGFDSHAPVDFLYNDPEKKFLVQFVALDIEQGDEPVDMSKVHEELDNVEVDLETNLEEKYGLPEHLISPYFKKIHTVFTMDALVRYVVAQEESSQQKPTVKEPDTQLKTERPHLIPALIVSIMMLIAVLPLPYGYYTFLRWATCGVGVFIAFQAYRWGRIWATWLFGAIAVLFNPFVPIYLTKEIWQPINILCGLLLGVSTILLGESETKTS